MSNGKVLIIEDDYVIARLLKVSLKTNNYEFELVNKGVEGISVFMNNAFDIVLLDLGLPDIDGMEVLNQLRLQSNIPIIIISAREKEKDKVQALDQGADDYLIKPFHVGELLARMRVALRKSTYNTLKQGVYEFRDLKVDIDKRKVYVKEIETHFTPIEYQLLVLLLENQGKVLTHKFLQKKVWGYETSDDYQTLRVFMASIRRKLELDISTIQYIQTEIGVGYRFIE
ncbi:MAG: response regulator transcription factor [Candidatus ainarchaeum sp.]|nr:response regulator transcription factor [Candidatus ainarchaeum sp.]